MEGTSKLDLYLGSLQFLLNNAMMVCQSALFELFLNKKKTTHYIDQALRMSKWTQIKTSFSHQLEKRGNIVIFKSYP